MEEDRQEFDSLMERLRAGCEDAARTLIERYGPHILRVVRRRLSRHLRSKFDSVDFVQAVWASFFAKPEELARLDRPEAIVDYLAHMAYHKVVDEGRRRLRGHARYNVRREHVLPEEEATRAAVAVQPTASQVAVAQELWDRLLEGKPAQHQDIIAMRRMGCTHTEIAEKLGVTDRTVRRVIRKLLSESIS